MHKVRIVQLNCRSSAGSRRSPGNNTFLRNADVFMDMLTDSGVNAMSDQQLAAMMIADDNYAGSATARLENKLHEIFGMPFFLPARGAVRAGNILAQGAGPRLGGADELPLHHHQGASSRSMAARSRLVADAGLEVDQRPSFKATRTSPS